MEDILTTLLRRRKETPFKPHPIPGLLGGMGPQSTMDFYQKIFQAGIRRGAREDQDHLQVLTSILPQTPDRTQSIVGNAETPLPHLLESTRCLEMAGADFLVIVCNTAHYSLNQLRQKCLLPLLSFEEETGAFLQQKLTSRKSVGLLATRGCLFQQPLYRYAQSGGLSGIHPFLRGSVSDHHEGNLRTGWNKGGRGNPHRP